jgi:hypothetical protein
LKEESILGRMTSILDNLSLRDTRKAKRSSPGGSLGYSERSQLRIQLCYSLSVYSQRVPRVQYYHSPPLFFIFLLDMTARFFSNLPDMSTIHLSCLYSSVSIMSLVKLPLLKKKCWFLAKTPLLCNHRATGSLDALGTWLITDVLFKP